MKILINENKIVYSVIHNRIYMSNNLSVEAPELLVKLPLSFIEVILYRLPIINRLLRRSIDHLAVINNSLIIFTNKNIFKYNIISKEIVQYNQDTIDYRVLTICNYNKKIYFGEYKSNPNRSPMRLLELDPESMLIKTIHTFEGIRHIHGVFFDNYTSTFWITTGDSNAESIIWQTDKSFKSFDRIVYGSQLYRAIKLLFTDNFIYYGTDTPLKENYICRINRESNEVEKLQKVDSSVFWGCKVNNHLFFSTTIEPSKINTTKYSVIWGSNDGDSWKPLAKYKKDLWHCRLFQYGQIFFPSGENISNDLYCTPFATKKHMTSIKFDVSQLF
jgi:hypothetical protein